MSTPTTQVNDRSTSPTEPVPCPACGGRFTAALDVRDENRNTSAVAFSYGRCEGCGLLRLLNPPADLAACYPPDYQVLPDRNRLAAVAHRERYQLDFLRAVPRGGRLVDIGASVGAFALAAKRAGFDVTAVEMDSDCVRHLADTVGVQAIASERPEDVLAGLPPSRVITLWQVLEHLRDPVALIEAAAANLEPGGLLVVATPNPGAWQLRVMGAHWPHLDAPRHLWLVPAAILVRVGERAGLRAVTLTTSDSGGRRWNRFGWQRLLMNRVDRRAARAAAFAAGAAISFAASPLERGRLRGACYTAVMQKARP
jgi:SAM-dependent methyltransferase